MKELQAEHLRRLLNEQGISQVALVRLIEKAGGTATEASVSNWIKGKVRMSRASAEDIARVFPEYGIDWLRGDSEYKDQLDRNMHVLASVQHDGELLAMGLAAFAEASGFVVRFPRLQTADGPSVEDALQAIKGEGELAASVSRNGKTVRLSVDDMNELENQICGYVAMRLERLIERGGW